MPSGLAYLRSYAMDLLARDQWAEYLKLGYVVRDIGNQVKELQAVGGINGDAFGNNIRIVTSIHRKFREPS